MNSQPDRNCYTLPNGDCVGNGCMHDSEYEVLGGPTVDVKKLTEKEYKKQRRLAHEVYQEFVNSVLKDMR